MSPEGNPWTPSSIALVMAGVTLIGVGLYFVLLRPPLLPEDVRYMALPAAKLDIFRPRLEAWLTHVFRVMGGYVLSTGVLAVTLAATAFRAQQKGAAIGALVGRGRVHWLDGGCKFCDGLGLKWFLLGIALLWARS